LFPLINSQTKMTQLKQIYKCNVCGNIVEMVHEGAGELVCCGQPMELKEANTEEAATEKHVPVIEKKDGKIIVKIGSDPHPMEAEHFIEWIELISGEKILRKNLKAGDTPEAEFCELEGELEARAYCNVHGLWKS